jgi:hypothetical protein
MNNPVEAVLSHYGKKGMKWGVRKAGSSSTERTTFAKAPKKLSDVELGKRIKRMETEKKYNQLNRKDVSEGKKLVADILTSSGRKVATTVLTGASLVAIKAALTSKLGESVAAEATRRLK